jgi:hypothetical protein
VRTSSAFSSLAVQLTVQLSPRATSVALGVRLAIVGGLLQPPARIMVRITRPTRASLIVLDFHIFGLPLGAR